jgi:hypothetical protein
VGRDGSTWVHRADAAGLEIDPGLIEALKSLGIVGAAAIIAFLYFHVMPEVREAKADLRELKGYLKRIADKLAPQTAAELEEAAVEERQVVAAPKKRAQTMPELSVVKE